MRNPDRIKPFLNKVEELWKKYPDLRFTQLLLVITNGEDLFYMEDNETLDIIENKLTGKEY